jgi:hypothetical protein
MEPKSAACISALAAFAFWTSDRVSNQPPDEVGELRTPISVRECMDDLHRDVMAGRRSLAEGSRLLTVMAMRDETVRIAYEVVGKHLDLRSADFLLQWTEDMTVHPREPHAELASDSLDRIRHEHAAMHQEPRE